MLIILLIMENVIQIIKELKEFVGSATRPSLENLRQLDPEDQEMQKITLKARFQEEKVVLQAHSMG